MGEKTHHLTAEEFNDSAWLAPNGVTVQAIESDSGDDFLAAYGLVDPDDFADAANERHAWDTGEVRKRPWTSEDVSVLWVVATVPAPDYWLTWVNVDAQTPGAFPLTVVGGDQ